MISKKRCLSTCLQYGDVLASCFPTPLARELVVLILEGERGTDVFAAVLGIQGLDLERTARVVKQHKDQLEQIQRHRTEILSLMNNSMKRSDLFAQLADLADRLQSNPMLSPGYCTHTVAKRNYHRIA